MGLQLSQPRRLAGRALIAGACPAAATDRPRRCASPVSPSASQGHKGSVVVPISRRARSFSSRQQPPDDARRALPCAAAARGQRRAGRPRCGGGKCRLARCNVWLEAVLTNECTCQDACMDPADDLCGFRCRCRTLRRLLPLLSSTLPLLPPRCLLPVRRWAWRASTCSTPRAAASSASTRCTTSRAGPCAAPPSFSSPAARWVGASGG